MTTSERSVPETTAEDSLSPSTPSLTDPPQKTKIVAIGASAGGHRSLEQIFTLLPPDTGFAFVVIMHLSPEGPSHLADLLSHYTIMPVATVREETPLQANTVYVIPPGQFLSIAKDTLQLEQIDSKAGVHHPIDHFFASLAKSHGEGGIGVILSGFGSDGSAGVKEIKEHNGLVLIQDPATAINESMPSHAIATGVCDCILPPEDIAAKLVDIAEDGRNTAGAARLDALSSEELQLAFTLLQAKTGHDFSGYKRNTVLRRIDRRMVMNDVQQFSKYLALLEENPKESEILYKELLIGVTGFFRDQEAFEILRKNIIPQLFANRQPDEPVRIWHACCATGEEAYSMAMLIAGYLEQESIQAKVQIFATDLDEGAINRARAGLYSSAIENELGGNWLNKYFSRVSNGWQVNKDIREMLVFAYHNILKDPPFSRLDLLVCRNLLIYLNHDMQKRLISLFHQVLVPDGVLFLGSAESVGLQSNLFLPIDKKWKIFSRQHTERRLDYPLPFFGPMYRMTTASNTARPAEQQKTTPAAQAERLLMERYVPARIIINERYEVIHFSREANNYLVTPEGEPTHDLLKLIKTELRPALRAATYKAFTEQKENIFQRIKVQVESGEALINLIVIPLKNGALTDKLALVIFEPAMPRQQENTAKSDVSNFLGDVSKDSVVRHLEEQLHVTSEQLQATSEQLESSNEGFLLANEELMATNEELQSANEELQATNEELETSKEELQALNEELITVNVELQGKIEELDQINNDLENLFSSAEIATIFLDLDLNIKRFSPAMASQFNLIPADIGRPFHHLSGIAEWADLPDDAQQVLATGSIVERELDLTEDKRSFIMRILPYRKAGDIIDGIVITLIDITLRKQMEMALKESAATLRLFIEQAPASLAMFDCQMRYLQVSRRWQSDYGLGDRDILGRSHYEIFPEITAEWKEAHRRGMNGEILRTDADLFIRADGSEQWIRWEIRPWRDAKDQIGGIVIFTEDITEIKKAEEVLRRYELLATYSRDIILFVERDGGTIIEANAAACRTYGYSRKELLQLTIHDLRGPGSYQVTKDQMDEAEVRGILFETIHYRKDGTFFVAEVNSQGAEIGGKRLLLSVIRDISERKKAEQALASANELRQMALDAAGLGAWDYNLQTSEVFWDDRCRALRGKDASPELGYQEALDQVHPEDRKTAHFAVQKALGGANNGIFASEHRVIWPDGSIHWLSSHGKVYFEEDGDRKTPVRFVGVNRDITKEKQTALASAHLAAVVASSDDAIISMDLQGKIQTWNYGAGQLFGYNADEMVGQPILAIIPPGKQHEERHILATLVNGGRLEHFETVRQTRDGSVVDVSLTVSPIHNNAGQLVGISKIARDITEKKRSAEALRASEQRLRLALEATSESIWDWDTQTGFVYRSGRYYELINRREEEDTHDFEFFRQTVHPDDLARVLATIEAHKDGRTPAIDFEYRLHPEPAQTKWLHVKGQVVQRDAKGAPLRIVGTVADITAFKDQAEKLRRSEQRRTLALEAAQAGTWEWDLATNKNIWSDELWAIYGLQPFSCEPSYKRWCEIIHPGDRARIEEELDDAVQQQVPFRLEWRVKEASGPDRWLMARGQPIFDTEGVLTHYLGIVMDITGRKQNEISRAKLEAQLQQAQKMEAIGTLAGGIAHDFNNILAAIMGYSEMAKEAHATGSDIASDLDKVLEAGGRAANLVRQILAFSRESHQEKVPIEPVYLIKEAIKLLRPALPSTISIKLVRNIKTKSILADPTQIHQVIMNLCTNAFHAMEDTGGILAISVEDCTLGQHDLYEHPDVQPGDFVRLTVSDTGPGIAPEIINKIFDPYFTTKDVGKGTGLGLAIVHGIASGTGGFISCKSAPGAGATFHVYFPAVEPEYHETATSQELDASGSERILLVDDEKMIIEMQKSMLERLGYHVTIRTSSLDALELFQANPDQFDAVITDQTMPGLTGINLARRILNIRPDLPVILCTGYSSQIDEEQVRTSGIKGFAMKPVPNKTLAMLLRQVLDGGTHHA